MTTETEQKPVTTEKPKPLPVTNIPVLCYELEPFDPASGKPPKAKPMRPSPMESTRGQWGRIKTKNRVRMELEGMGHQIHAINFGETKDDGARCLVVYIWGKNAAPPKPPSKPVIPPARARRTATSRRHAPRPETRKKP